MRIRLRTAAPVPCAREKICCAAGETPGCANPDVLLVDVLLPGLDSFSAALDIRRVNPTTKIAMLTRHQIPDQLFRIRRLRLNGLISKYDTTDELFYAIRTILNGGFYTPPSMSTALRDQAPSQDPLGVLTQREKSVLTLYAQGWSIKEIANELNVSVKTAETHRNNLGRGDFG